MPLAAVALEGVMQDWSASLKYKTLNGPRVSHQVSLKKKATEKKAVAVTLQHLSLPIFTSWACTAVQVTVLATLNRTITPKFYRFSGCSGKRGVRYKYTCPWLAFRYFPWHLIVERNLGSLPVCVFLPWLLRCVFAAPLVFFHCYLASIVLFVAYH